MIYTSTCPGQPNISESPQVLIPGNWENKLRNPIPNKSLTLDAVIAQSVENRLKLHESR